ncbi:MAG: YDG domain-containing protein, partial [Sulfuricurvum sp.]|nr:YDG domain-containing protein [Sulfuricurvum sp.]
TLNALVENKGLIRAEGGQVYLTTQALNTILDGMVNNTGVIEAESLGAKDGKIVLFAHGGSGEFGGTLSTGVGKGFIETSGKEFLNKSDLKVETKEWLIDPVNVTIDTTLAGTIQTALGSGNVTITTAGSNTPSTASGESGTDGDITVNSAISWSTAKTLTLNAARNIYINAPITASNASGKLSLLYGQGAVAAGNAATYDFGLTSSGFTGTVNLKAGSNFSTKLGSNGTLVNYTVITSSTALQNIKNSLTTNYAIGADIDLSSIANFTPIMAANGTGYSGMFDGLGHKISHLSINQQNTVGVALFGTINTNFVRNIGVTDVAITGSQYVAGLVGNNVGTISNSYVTGSVMGAGTEGCGVIGGLVGNNVGTISNSFSMVSVTADLSTSNSVGGLVGQSLIGTISNSYATGSVAGYWNVGGLVGQSQIGTISNSYATGSVSGHQYIGGLVGYSRNSSIIHDSYAAGSVTGDGYAVGGLVGNNFGSTISGSFATGSVTGSSGSVGGLIGVSAGTVVSSFWDTETTGQSVSAGGAGAMGKTTAQMSDIATFGAEDWSIATGSGINSPYPSLTMGKGTTVWTIPLAGTPATYTLTSLTDTYKAGAFTLSNLWNAHTIFGGLHDDWVAGTDYSFMYGGNAVTSFTNAGTYSNIGISVLASGFTTASSGNTLGSLLINKAMISSVTGITASNKIYDGTLAATLQVGNAVFNGILGSDTLSVTGATGAFTDKNAGTGKSVNITGLTLSGESVANYELGSSASTATANITLKAITVSATAQGKTYDGTIAATTTLTSADIIEGDTVTLAGTGTFDTKNVGTVKVVTVASLAKSGTDATNYTISNETASATANITPKAITVSATAEDKVYDGTTSATMTLTSADIVEGDTITLAGTETFDTKNVGTEKAVTVASLTKSGVDAANYTISNETASATANITRKALTLNGAVASNKVYDGLTTASISSYGTLNGVIEGESVAISTTNATAVFDTKNAGTAKTVSISGVTISGQDAGNYSAGSSMTTTANITPKAITVSATAGNKTYDGTTTATTTLNSADIIEGDTVTLAGTGTFDTKNAGTAKTVIVASMTKAGNDAGNYTISNETASATADIAVKAITLTGTMANNKVYDGLTTASISSYGTLDGIVEGDVVAIGTTNATAEFDTKNAGTGKTVTVSGLKLLGSAAANYSIGIFSTTAMIEKANATVTANSDTKTYNGLTQTVNGFSASGLVNGETIEVLDGVSGSIASGKNAGTYKTALVGTDENYNLTFVDGVLTINAPVNNDVITTIQNSTAVTPLASIVVSPLVPQATAAQTQTTQLIQNIMPQSQNGEHYNLVGTTDGETPLQTVSMEQLQKASTGQGINEIRVPLGQDSIVELLNGGVNLPKGLSQEFYVVADNGTAGNNATETINTKKEKKN